MNESPNDLLIMTFIATYWQFSFLIIDVYYVFHI